MAERKLAESYHPRYFPRPSNSPQPAKSRGSLTSDSGQQEGSPKQWLRQEDAISDDLSILSLDLPHAERYAVKAGPGVVAIKGGGLSLRCSFGPPSQREASVSSSPKRGFGKTVLSSPRGSLITASSNQSGSVISVSSNQRFSGKTSNQRGSGKTVSSNQRGPSKTVPSNQRCVSNGNSVSKHGSAAAPTSATFDTLTLEDTQSNLSVLNCSSCLANDKRTESPSYQSTDNPTRSILNESFIAESLALDSDTTNTNWLEETINNILSDEQSILGVNSDLLKSCMGLGDAELRAQLTAFGYDVGPITEGTRALYAKQLARCLAEDSLTGTQTNFKAYSAELQSILKSGNVGSNVDAASLDEAEMISYFDSRPLLRQWREGYQKLSFCYLLLDPTQLTYVDNFSSFLASIFYVGKGKNSRPYQHLWDALDVYDKQSDSAASDIETLSTKLQRILSIWREQRSGVISVHVFHNIIPVEAYTREACMIDAIGLKNLANARRGDYYGIPSTWTVARKRRLGAYFLRQAWKICQCAPLRSLRPDDVRKETGGS